MSGFLERLAQRGQGGTDLASLPTIRPMPAIYGSAKGSERGAVIEPRDADISDAQSATADSVPTKHRPEPARPAPGPSPRASVQASAAPDRTEPVRPSEAVASPGSTVSPSSARMPSAEGSAPRREKLEPQAHADPSKGIAQISQPRTAPAEADHFVRNSREGVPSPAEPDAEPSRAVAPARTRSGLERLFEAIEAADEAGTTSGSAAARRADVPAVPHVDNGPVVSIGRITISVAPPPAAPRAAPTGPPRSHGFSAYARLRGGYER